MATKTDLIELLASTRHTLPDEKALVFKKMYQNWRADIEITQKDIDDGKNRYQHDEVLWKCIKPHTTRPGWEPSVDTASLWTAINETHEGTSDDPIPVPEQLTSFEYTWGKYYVDGDTLYLCNRQGGKEGDTYTLAYKPSQLVGQYFEVA